MAFWSSWGSLLKRWKVVRLMGVSWGSQGCGFLTIALSAKARSFEMETPSMLDDDCG